MVEQKRPSALVGMCGMGGGWRERGVENLSLTSSVKSFWLIVAEQEKGSVHKFLSEILSLQTQHVPDIRTSHVPAVDQ